MNLHRLNAAPCPWLGEALERFECQFRYPLGEHASFRIAHGRQYVPFFQAMGEMTLLVAERDGEVLGTLAGIRRDLRLPDGEVHRVTYLCDLKVSAARRSGRTLLHLIQTMADCWRNAGGGGGYSVVMDGSAHTPQGYTGRCGIPAFVPMSKLAILKLGVPPVSSRPADVVEAGSGAQVEAVWQQLAAGRCLPLGGTPGMRSSMPPVPLLGQGSRACGVVEDTRKGKRLLLDSGGEMAAAHLSRFAFTTPADGEQLLRRALLVAAQSGFPALFVAVPPAAAPELLHRLADVQVTVAAATIHGSGLNVNADWAVDTAEI